MILAISYGQPKVFLFFTTKLKLIVRSIDGVNGVNGGHLSFLAKL